MLRKILVFIPCFIVGILLHGWAALALFYCVFPIGSPLRPVIAVVYAVAVLSWIILNKKHTQAFFNSLLGFVVIALWFNAIEPKAGGVYPPELTLPNVTFSGDQVTLRDVRDSDYRTPTDFDVRYEPRTYDLKDVKTMDVMVNYWGMDAIAHTFLSFGFADGRYLCVSVEIRPEVGKAYDMLQGFFKQYQIIYIWADERDLVRLRTNYKKENVYLYRSSLSADNVQKMLVDMLKATAAIYAKPEFYNTLTHSCTNTLGDHLISAKIINLPIWKRRFLTGDVDQRMYKEGLLVDQGLQFPELRKQANIDARAKQADRDPDFSQRIRTHLIYKNFSQKLSL
jgi:hypothetical protein